MSNEVLVGPVFSLKNLEAEIGHLDQDTWAEVKAFQAGMKKDVEGVTKTFNLRLAKAETDVDASFVRGKVLLAQVSYREYSKLDKLLFPVFRAFGRIINKVRGL